MGILYKLSDTATVVSKNTGETLRKRELTLIDDSATSVSLTLWNDDITRITESKSAVVYLSRVRTKVYAGVISLVLAETSDIEINPKKRRSTELTTWWKTHGTDPQIIHNKMEKTLDFAAMRKQLASPNRAMDPAPFYFWNVVRIRHLDAENVLYKSCSEERCSKRVEKTNEGEYFCEMCNKATAKYRWAYSLKFYVEDKTDTIQVTGFDKVSPYEVLEKTHVNAES